MQVTESGFVCVNCDVTYPARNGQPDMRPVRPVVRTIDVTVGGPRSEPPVGPIVARQPAVAGIDWGAEALVGGNRLTPGLVERIPAGRTGEALLDHGCGDTRLGRAVARVKGYDYVGIDYEGDEPTALADAHALPFADGSVAAALSIAVFEHIADPFLAARELGRVLRPAGVLVGTVAFLEPFHLHSYFHMTHVGLYEVLTRGGLEVDEIEANAGWLGHDAQRDMAGGLLRVGDRIGLNLDRLLRRRGSKLPPDRLSMITAGFRFIAHRHAA